MKFLRVVLTFDLDFGEIAGLARRSTVSVVSSVSTTPRTTHVVGRLAILDAYGESEQRTGFLTMPEDNLELPFETVVLGVAVTVERIDLTQANEIVAIYRKDGKRQTLPILDLPLPSPLPAGAEWIEAYRCWSAPESVVREVKPVVDYHRRVIDARLRKAETEARSGKTYGPFSSVHTLTRSLRPARRSRAGNKHRKEHPVMQSRSAARFPGSHEEHSIKKEATAAHARGKESSAP